MKSISETKRTIKNFLVTTNSEMDKKVYNDVLPVLKRRKLKASVTVQAEFWRIIMTSKLAQTAAAAVIIVACLTGLIFWKTTGSGIALADVLTRIKNIDAYRYQLHSTVTKQQKITESVITVLISKEHGLKMLEKRINPKSGELEPGMDSYFLRRPNAILTISHGNKMYVKYQFEEDKARSSREEYNDPCIIIEQFMQCKHTRIGQSIIDGIKVEGFHTTDLAYPGGVFGQADLQGEPEKVDATIWVDVTTSLPVKSEETMTMKDGRHIHEVSDNFQWTVVVTTEDFKPIIPKNYTTDELVFPKYNEETAVKGLKLLVELTGKYPVTIEKGSFNVPKLLKFPKSGPRAWKALPEDERRDKTSKGLLISGVGFFYQKLIDGQREPVYYGEDIQPGDADKILLRWKLHDGQYRVIFGDLSAKTVTAEELSNLEKP
jgi:hypothetical protein